MPATFCTLNRFGFDLIFLYITLMLDTSLSFSLIRRSSPHHSSSSLSRPSRFDRNSFDSFIHSFAFHFLALNRSRSLSLHPNT